jgi:hypothetical protein
VELTATRRLFLWTLVASLCVTAAIAIGTLLFAEFDDTAARILLTTTFLSVASLLSLPAGVLLDQGRAPGLAWGTIAAAVAGFLAAMAVVWADPDAEWVWKLALTFGLAGVAGAQAAASTSRRSPADSRRLAWIYVLGIVLTVALATLIAVAVWWEIQDSSAYYRLLGATAVAAVLATLLQPILRRLARPAERAHELVLKVDKPPSDEAVAAAIEALGRHGIGAEVVGRPRV